MSIEASLIEARDTFARYAEIHDAKGTPEAAEKARANRELSQRMDGALQQWRSLSDPVVHPGAGPMVRKMLEQHIEVEPDFVADRDELTTWQVRLRVDHQSFGVSERMSLEDAEWMQDQLAVALARLVESHS